MLAYRLMNNNMPSDNAMFMRCIGLSLSYVF